MPVKVKKVGNKYRIIESSGRISRTKTGATKDGGGHLSKAKAVRQMRAINAGLKKKGKI